MVRVEFLFEEKISTIHYFFFFISQNTKNKNKKYKEKTDFFFLSTATELKKNIFF
jgi:hypothetical protein